MNSKAFWLGLLERGVKTFAQALVAGLAVGTGLLHMDWATALDVAAGATALSVLTSLATSTTVLSTSPTTKSVDVIVNPVIPPPAGPTTRS